MAVKPLRYGDNTFRIAYEILNSDAKQDLIILHGWGSDKDLMKQAFGRHLKNWRHIYIDLPGFGQSGCDVPLTTEDYSAIVDHFLAAIGAKKDVAVGHSFGGKVATLIDPDRLVLLSSAGIVMPKPLKVRMKIALFKALKPLGGGKLRQFFASKDVAHMNEVMYQTFKNVVDEDFSDRFRAYDNPALLCWGRDDTATPPEAGRRIAELMPKAELEIFDGDHYFFLHRPEAVSQRMEAFLEAI